MRKFLSTTFSPTAGRRNTSLVAATLLAAVATVGYAKQAEAACTGLSETGTNSAATFAASLEKHVTLQDTEIAPFENAKAIVSAVYNATGVTITIDVHSIPDYVCAHGTDLVELVLETRTTAKRMATISVVQPTKAKPHVRVVKTYTYAELLAFFSTSERPADVEAMKKSYPIWAVEAFWYERKSSGDGNQPGHWTGGLGQKQGVGAFRIADESEEEAAIEDTTFKTGWNAGGPVGREGLAKAKRLDLLRKHGTVLNAAKELATSLEAESEYMVDKAGFDAVLLKMRELSTKTKDQLVALGITGIVKITDKTPTAPKESTDTYFDFVSTDPYNLFMLKNNILMRRRTVVGDAPDLYLLALKAQSAQAAGDEYGRIRISSQVHLGKVDPTAAELRKFLLDSTWNPFAQVFQEAFKAAKDKRNLAAALKFSTTVVPVLRVTAKRFKFDIELDDLIKVDFSLDEATGIDARTTADKRTGEQKVYSFEFGLGHPGATASASAATDGSTREYHTTFDLGNDELFERDDYKKYKTARNAVIGTYGRMTTTPGGYKAPALAKLLGMIP